MLAAATSVCHRWPHGAWPRGSWRRSVPTWRTACRGPVGVLVSAWPAVALVGSFELLMLLIRSAHQHRPEHVWEAAADLPVPVSRQGVPPAGAFLEQTVRAWRTAGHGQRAIARELNIDRRKVKQILDRDDAA